MEIDWDPKKAEANVREHGVSFSEAATVLTDDYALTREDPDAIGEQRFVSLGMNASGAMLVVVYTHREARYLSPDFGLEGQQAAKDAE
jgi:uncharacterized protein